MEIDEGLGFGLVEGFFGFGCGMRDFFEGF